MLYCFQFFIFCSAFMCLWVFLLLKVTINKLMSRVTAFCCYSKSFGKTKTRTIIELNWDVYDFWAVSDDCRREDIFHFSWEFLNNIKSILFSGRIENVYELSSSHVVKEWKIMTTFFHKHAATRLMQCVTWDWASLQAPGKKWKIKYVSAARSWMSSSVSCDSHFIVPMPEKKTL